jgi:AcrR family transcriptional regulator
VTEAVAEPVDERAEKRERILAAAMRRFAEYGYPGAKIEDIAIELEIAKGSIFQHFGSKANLFLEAYKRAVATLPAWLDAPEAVKDRGFFAVVDYWLERTEHLVTEDRVAYRVALVGNYGADLPLRREINRFLLSEDPYGTLEFVEWGQAGGEIRSDIEAEVLASMVDWWSGSLQDALVTEELDPGLFHRLRGDPDRRRTRVEQFAELLRSALAPR